LKLASNLSIGFLIIIISVISVWSVLLFQLNQFENQSVDLQDGEKELQKTAELNDLATDIKYYDESLTQSARNYAFTGDAKWKEKYIADEPKLDEIIKRSNELGDESDHEFFASIDNANRALVEMEYESIKLVDQGKSADAVKILESKQYWDLKKTYAQGLASYTAKHDSVETSLQHAHAHEIVMLTTKIGSFVSNTINILVTAIPIIVILSTIFIIMIFRGISKPVTSLIEALKKVSTGNFETEIKIGGNDEIHDLAASFNLMSKQLKGYAQKVELDKAKDEFMAMISHELKTPLVPITGYTSLLLADKYGKLTANQRNKIQIIQSSTQSLLKLISDLLDVQKIELGKLRLDVKNENMSEIILDAIEKTKPDTDKFGIRVTTDLQNDLYCMCDKNRIEQVISNILLNSSDFCSKNTGRIHVTARSHDGLVSIVVKDNGIGMTKENIAKLFAKFYQGDTSSTREHSGTGLGLAVCKGIVTNHGGKIWIESEGIERGTEVHITIPVEIDMDKVPPNTNLEQTTSHAQHMQASSRV
jgi:signal transduction histidine kinase